MEQQPCSSLGRLISEVSRSHTDTPHSVGLLGARDRSVEVAATHTTQQTQETNSHAPGGIRTRIRSKPAAAELRAMYLGL
jgi:hypothetical protein